MSPGKTTTTTTFFEVSTIVVATVFAFVCFFALELSRTWFIGVNFAVLAIHAYFLGNAVLTTERDAPKRTSGAFYSISSLTVLLASAVLKYVRVEA